MVSATRNDSIQNYGTSGGELCELSRTATKGRTLNFDALILSQSSTNVVPYANNLDPGPSCLTIGHYFHQL